MEDIIINDVVDIDRPNTFDVHLTYLKTPLMSIYHLIHSIIHLVSGQAQNQHGTIEIDNKRINILKKDDGIHVIEYYSTIFDLYIFINYR